MPWTTTSVTGNGALRPNKSLELGSYRTELARNLRWLLIARTIFLAGTVLLVLLVALSARELIPPTIPLLKFAAAGFAANLIYLGMFASGKVPLVQQAYLQFLSDLLLISGLVYLTGGASSLFSMLYLMVIAAAATILRRRAGVTIAEIAWLLYAATVVSLYLGWLGPAEASEAATASTTSIGRLTYALFVHLAGFYGVALLTSLLSNQAARAERKLAVATSDLEALESLHRDVVESMSSGLAILDLDDDVISINRTGRSILGLSEDFEGARLEDLGLLEKDRWAQLRAEAGNDRIRDEVSFVGADGDTRFVGFSVGVIRDATNQARGHSLVFQDLTEWRRLQVELGVKERMAAVGELAAGLAHEIGNPLAAISGSVQMLRSSSEPDSADNKLLEIVLKESQRLDRTIKGFLRFAKPHERNDHRFDICTLVRENIELLHNSDEVLPAHQLEADLEPQSVSLIADRDQIVQVFWNLARNALRAMPEGGCFTVVGRVNQAGSKSTYRLSFEDNGGGMTEEQKHGLFHPFRSYQRGTGIGMAIVYRIVDAHRGKIQVESTVGAGTTIEIQLPL